jgi:hypothetical protein
MAVPKFKVGQTVDFTPGRSSIPASQREYKVVRVVPLEGGERQYRIKTIAEQFERVAKESELSTRPGL